MSYLSAERLRQVAEAFQQLPFTYDPPIRTALFTSVHPNFVGLIQGGLPPLLQLLSDLGRLNTQDRLSDGSVPFLIWLTNVAQLASATEQRKIFSAAADDIAHRVSGAPRVDPPDLPEFKEAIVHQDDMVSHGFMAQGLAASDAVAKLRVPRYEQQQLTLNPNRILYLGTAWLLSESLLITNHHVINARNEGEAAASDADLDLQARAAEVQFDFNDDGLQGTLGDVSALVAWEPKLDYAVLRMTATQRKPLRIAPTALEQKVGHYTPVNIVQHPAGESKKYAIRNNLVSAITPTIVRYFTDTRAGSSGAPVLDDTWQVVALHRGSSFADGVKFQGRSTAWVNIGTPIHAILEDLEQRYPAVYSLLPH